MSFYNPALYRPAARGRTWRDDAPDLASPALMLRPNTLDELLPVDAPRDCVVTYQIGPDRVLLVSYDKDGKNFEEFRTTKAGASDLAATKLLARVRAHDAKRALRLMR